MKFDLLDLFNWSLIIFIILLIIFAFINMIRNNWFGSYKKREKLNKQLKQLFPDLNFSFDKKVTLEEIKNLKLFNSYNKALGQITNSYKTTDKINGKYKKYYFKYFEIYFKGAFDKITINGGILQFQNTKNINNPIWIYSKDINKLKRYPNPKNDITLKKMSTDHTLFNKFYDVYCANEEEIFYLLTPNFMELLIKMNYHTLNKRNIIIVYNKNNIIIYADKLDLFQPRLWIRSNKKILNIYKKDLDVITEIMKTLKINKQE